MLVLFDPSAPAPLRSHWSAHRVALAKERGWDRLQNDLVSEPEHTSPVFLLEFVSTGAAASGLPPSCFA